MHGASGLFGRTGQRLHLRPGAGVVTQAREAATTFCATRTDAETAAIVSLLVTELVANAERHGGGALDLDLSCKRGYVHVGVRDASAIPPVLVPPDPSRENGRGVGLVDSLASLWGCEAAPPGKWVWFELPRFTSSR